MENRIIVIVPFRNVAKYIQQCWHSLAEQEYGNYKLVFSDDCSSDGSLSLIPENERFIRIRYDHRMYALANIYHSIMRSEPEDEDIIAIVDGDDFLLHNRVFYKINEIYKQKDCLLTYGQYCTADGNMMYKTPYTKDEFRSLRTCDFRATHLKTFRFKLFKNFLKQDPELDAYKDEEGAFYSMTYDAAMMYPLMEIAGYENVYFVRDILYVYRLYPMNDMQINRGLQNHFFEHIQTKRPFERMFRAGPANL